MTFNKKILSLFITLAFITYGNAVFAQQLLDEPAGGMDENDQETPDMMLPMPNNSIPSIIDIPSVKKYYTSWDTLCVRRHTEISPSTEDSIRLPLFNPYSTGFVMPVEGTFLSPFGHRGRRLHAGVDIKLNAGDPVVCAFDGVVRMARRYAGYGNCVVIRHYNGLETLYGHLSKINVRVNNQVKAGDIIGLGGHTGHATCNHLHFETRFQGRPFNPKQLISFDNFNLVADTLTVTNATFGRSRDYIPGVSADEDSFTYSKKHKSKGHKSKSTRFYTIRRGDTLSSISRKSGTSVKQLCAINKIKPNKTLQLGKKIKLH